MNQGFNNNPYQGQYPPPYGQPNQNMGFGGPPAIIIDTGLVAGTVCPVCGHNGMSIPRKRMGAAACAWCWCLFFTTGLLWLIPICSGSCKDIEQLCDRCGAVKGVIPGNCC